MSYACPCCGSLTLGEQPPGTFEICPMCDWEDDYAQFIDLDLRGGANTMSLNQARKEFMERQDREAKSHDRRILPAPPNSK